MNLEPLLYQTTLDTPLDFGYYRGNYDVNAICMNILITPMDCIVLQTSCSKR